MFIITCQQLFSHQTMHFKEQQHINNRLIVNGIANFHNDSPYALNNSFMQSGSLTIGGIMLIMEMELVGLVILLVY
jgi:hypothetical protein